MFCAIPRATLRSVYISHFEDMECFSDMGFTVAITYLDNGLLYTHLSCLGRGDRGSSVF